MDIEIKNLNKTFGKQIVLSNLSLTLPQGECTCVMGASGIGKTTLLRILLGLEKADSGEILGLNGLKAAAVFQEDRLIEGSDAYKNVQLTSASPLSKEELDQRFASIGLEDYKEKPVSELSGGMKRRVAILRALSSDYDFLVLDEPFKGLDEALKQKVMAYVARETQGKTVLLVTHDPTEAAALHANIHTLS